MADSENGSNGGMDYVEDFKEKILSEYERMNEDSEFKFECGKNMKCFTACCGDVNIFLTPYDVLRMKNRLGISSQEFLEKYTINPFTKTQKLPSVLLKMDQETKRCQFVTREDGCTIYEDRPWACRMYPLGKASPRDVSSGTGSDREFYFLMAEDECLGVKEGKKTFTVKGWIEDQGIADYDEMGEYFKKVCLHPMLDEIDPTPQKMEMFYMACYNLDNFRRFITESRFGHVYDVTEEEIEKAAADDVELLKFGIRWLLFGLFNESTMKVRQEVLDKRRKAMDLDKKDTGDE